MSVSIKVIHQFKALSVLILGLFFTISHFSVFAQEDGEKKSQKIDRQYWTDLKKDLDYDPEGKDNEEALRSNWSDQEGERGEATEFRRRDYNYESSSEPLFGLPPVVAQIFKYAFIIMAICLLIFLILKSAGQINLESDKVSVETSILEVKDLHHEMPLSDLELALKENLEKGQWKNVVRIYYLIIIKELSDRKLISWKREKTNLHYIKEISSADTQGQLKQFPPLTRFFEKVWYGTLVLDQTKFNSVQGDYIDFINKIKEVERKR